MPRPIYEAGTYTEWWMFRLPDPRWCIEIVEGLLSQLLDEAAFEPQGSATQAQAVAYFLDALRTLTHMPLKAGMTDFSFEATIPPNWLLCDGATYADVDYPLLSAELGAAFRVDGSHFHVPDMRRRFPLGDDNSTGLGDTGGLEDVTLSTLQIPAHNHSDAGHSHVDAGHTHAESLAAPTAITIGAGVPAPSALPAVSVTGIGFASIQTGFASIQNTGGGQSHTNMPPWIAGRWLIWTGV